MSHHITKQDLQCLEDKLSQLINIGEQIMSAISDFAMAQNAFNDQMDVNVAGLQDDIKSLNDTITKLQNSPGVITPEDQKSLDDLQNMEKILQIK